MESLALFKTQEAKSHKKRNIQSYFDIIEKANNDLKVKNIIEFSDQDVAGVKAIAVKKKR